MKILILTSRFPYPLDKGDKLRAYHQLKWIAKKHDVHLVCTTDEYVSNKEVESLKSELNIEISVFRLYRLNQLFNLSLGYLFTQNPFQVNYFYQRKIHKAIKQIISEFKPNHIYCQLLRMGEYVKREYSIPKTIDYMDALSKSMLRRANTEKGIKKWIVKLEADRLKNYETRIFEYFEHKTIISEQDKRYIIHPEKHNIQVVPNGIDTLFFYPKNAPKIYDIAFNGNMSYPPNIEAAKFIVHKIAPLLSENINILISGTSPTNEIKNLETKQIVISGYVEDIRDSYASTKIFVAPMQIGAGLQNKLLEAMAMGIPCITSSLANNALGAKDKEEILIANSPEEYAILIKELLNNPELYHKIASNGKTYVINHFDWKSTTNILNNVFLSV